MAKDKPIATCRKCELIEAELEKLRLKVDSKIENDPKWSECYQFKLLREYVQTLVEDKIEPPEDDGPEGTAECDAIKEEVFRNVVNGIAIWLETLPVGPYGGRIYKAKNK